MGVSIDYFFRLTDAIANKNQSGNSITISQKNQFANQAQLAKFEADRNGYIETGNLTKYLTFFLKNIVKQVPPDGNLPYPSDWQHTVSMRSYFIRPNGKSVEVEVSESKDKSWGEIQISSLLMPTSRFPKYMEFANEFRFLPKSIGTVYVDYLATPTPPIWAYTTVNNRPVYDVANSVNFDFEEFSLNEIASIYLSLIGVNLKDGELSAFAQQFQQTSKAVE